MENNAEKKLYKSKKSKMISGVCGGLGEYFNIDPTLVRLAFVILCIFAGGGLIAYIVALIIVPEAPEGYVPPAATAGDQSQMPPETDSSETINTNAASENKKSADSHDENSPTML